MSDEIKSNINKVKEAVKRAGGLIANKPQDNKARKGQLLKLENAKLNFGKSGLVFSCMTKDDSVKSMNVWEKLARNTTTPLSVYYFALTNKTDLNKKTNVKSMMFITYDQFLANWK